MIYNISKAEHFDPAAFGDSRARCLDDPQSSTHGALALLLREGYWNPADVIGLRRPDGTWVALYPIPPLAASKNITDLVGRLFG